MGKEIKARQKSPLLLASYPLFMHRPRGLVGHWEHLYRVGHDPATSRSFYTSILPPRFVLLFRTVQAVRSLDSIPCEITMSVV